MSTTGTTARSWDDIASHPGLATIERRMREVVIPQLEAMPTERTGEKASPNPLNSSFLLGAGLFGIALIITFSVLPDTWWGIALKIILFPLMFFGAIAAAIRLRWGAIRAYLLRTGGRLRARRAALREIAAMLGLEFVATPGNTSPAEVWLLGQSWVDDELKAALADIGGDGRMGDAVAAAMDAGLMGPETIVLGSAEQKAAFANHEAQGRRVEDGFRGTRNGVAFNLFEWIETDSDAPDIHHLVIVLEAPIPLQARHEIRSRKIGWIGGKGEGMAPVDLGAREFADQYRLRSTDQVEARTLFDPAVMARLIELAHGDAFRGVAEDANLVFDFAGADRFALLNRATGEWSDESLRAAITDLIETLDLVDALAATFRVARQ